MGEGDKRIAQLIRLFEQEHEAGDASAGDRAHDQRQNSQQRKAPALASQFGNHSLGARYRLPEGETSFRHETASSHLLRFGVVVA